MDKSKVIEKIKKCMALGSSSNANDAAAADFNINRPVNGGSQLRLGRN